MTQVMCTGLKKCEWGGYQEIILNHELLYYDIDLTDNILIVPVVSHFSFRLRNLVSDFENRGS